MELSQSALNLIKTSEGFRTHTYMDVAGIPTIGYGHRLLPHEVYPGGISETQASELLVADVRGACQAVGRLVKVPLTQGQFDALADFCFNLGSARLASSTLLTKLNQGQYDAARQQILRWDMAGGEVRKALKARRQSEFDLWGGEFTPPPAGLAPSAHTA